MSVLYVSPQGYQCTDINARDCKIHGECSEEEANLGKCPQNYKATGFEPMNKRLSRQRRGPSCGSRTDFVDTFFVKKCTKQTEDCDLTKVDISKLDVKTFDFKKYAQYCGNDKGTYLWDKLREQEKQKQLETPPSSPEPSPPTDGINPPSEESQGINQLWIVGGGILLIGAAYFGYKRAKE